MNRLFCVMMISALHFGCASTEKEPPGKPASPSPFVACMLPSINKVRMGLFDRTGYFREIRYIKSTDDAQDCDLIVNKTAQGRSWHPLSLLVWPVQYQRFEVLDGAKKRIWKLKTYAIADNQLDVVPVARLYEHFQPGSAGEKKAIEAREARLKGAAPN